MAAARTVVIALLTIGTPIWFRACLNLHAEDTIKMLSLLILLDFKTPILDAKT